MKKLIFIISIISILITIGALLNPLDRRMFNFHDDTQAARIQQMALSIKSGKIPPRLAPEFSNNLGFPVFNFYAPSAYWITTGFYLAGMPIPMALKFSFLLSVTLSFVAMFLFLHAFFGFLPSILGGIAYSSSLWFAIEIFIRGNLAECWFLVLFPLSLYILTMNSRKQSAIYFVLSVLIISFTLTVHNVFSFLALGIFVMYSFLLKNKKRNLFVIVFGLLLSAYFLFPAVIELPLTYATKNAQLTNYKDHFLCIWQIWRSQKWEFAGSSAGCFNDGMPFMLGKIHIILGTAGAIYFIFRLFQKNKKDTSNTLIYLFMLLLGSISVFLTTYQSTLIWGILKPILSLFQFPWRFLIFVVFSLSFFTAYLFAQLHAKFPKLSHLAILLIAFVLLLTSKKFFSKPWLMSYDEYATAFLSSNYVSKTVAYNIAEYLPKTADYNYWRSFDPQIYPGNNIHIGITKNSPIEIVGKKSFEIIENSPFSKKVFVNKPSTVLINIHYFPFWKIDINSKKIAPQKFDKLGRPILNLETPSTVYVRFNETIVEKIGNLISFLTLFFIIVIFLYKPLWNKLKRILK